MASGKFSISHHFWNSLLFIDCYANPERSYNFELIFLGWSLYFELKTEMNGNWFNLGNRTLKLKAPILKLWSLIFLVLTVVSCGYCSSWCKIGDKLYSFVSRWSHFGCWLRRFDCNTASLHQAMKNSSIAVETSRSTFRVVSWLTLQEGDIY